jgi:hypothetical protein
MELLTKLFLEENNAMLEEETKYFMWYDSTRGGTLTYGPHYSGSIKKSSYHSLEYLLKTRLSEPVKKRVKGAKIGTIIKAHYLHFSGDMMLKRISLEEKDILDKMLEMDSELEKLNDKIREIKKEYDSLVIKVLPKAKAW